jgi:hypothetical protein
LGIARLPSDLQAHLGTLSETVLLSSATRDSHRHHGWTADEFGHLQAMLDHGEVRADRDRHLVIAHLDGNWRVAALKVTGDRKEVFLQTFHSSNERNIVRFKLRGVLVRE